MRIRSELVRTADNKVIRGQTYEAPFTDQVFALQERIALQVLETLQARTESRKHPPRIIPTHNMEAYREYLIGRSLAAVRTDEALKSAIRHYQQATARDSSFAMAYAALATAWVVYPNFWSRTDSSRNLAPSSAVAYAMSEKAAQQALSIDLDLFEARATLAYAKFLITAESGRAIPELEAVVQQAPDDPTIRTWYRHALGAAGREVEALQQSQRAVELDPLAPVGNTILGVDLAATGDTAAALVALRRVVELNPGFAAAYMVLGALLLQRGETAAGAASLCRFLVLRGYDVTRAGVVEAALAGRGSRAEAIEALEGFTRTEWEPEVRLAGFFALLGARGRALDILEAARARRVGDLLFMRYQPFLAPLRREPRFEAIWARDAWH
ncbi:MAG: hypothetical protein ABI647_14595 [Gemmatimonadota bacterium]